MATPQVSRCSTIVMAIIGALAAVSSIAGAVAIAAAYDWDWATRIEFGRQTAPLWVGTLLLLFLAALGVVLTVWSVADVRSRRARPAETGN